jgi:endoglucanase
LLGLALAAAMGLASVASSETRGPRAFVVHPGQQLCPEPYSSRRNLSNPLALRRNPGPNPLNGARLSVPGPRYGEVAGGLARLLGINPWSFGESYSWAAFKRNLDHGSLHRRLRGNPSLAYAVHLLEKIASQPETERMSMWSEGGGPGALYDETQKLYCGLTREDRGSIPVFNTYFLYQAGYCESAQEILARRGTFQRQVSEMAEAIDRRPAVILVEMDAIGSSSCMQRTGALRYWEGDISYEVNKFTSLPHTVVYIEAGYSDAESAQYTARALKAVGIKRVRGFYTNDTHMNWTMNEIKWGWKVPARQGNEDLCNPPNRGAGPRPTTHTGLPRVDAFLWVHVPGESAGPCNGGTASGTFWLANSLVEARNANGRLGPRSRSRPY